MGTRGMWVFTTIAGMALAFLHVGAASSSVVHPAISRRADSPHGSAAPAARPSSSRCWEPKAEELGFTHQMNQARANNQRGRLRLDPELSKAARVHTREMVDLALLHHTSNEALGHRVTRWRILGENVGVGNTVDSLQQAFMASPPHRENIMYPEFRYVGVGVATTADRMWVTVIFENRVDPGTVLHMRSCKSSGVILRSRAEVIASGWDRWVSRSDSSR